MNRSRHQVYFTYLPSDLGDDFLLKLNIVRFILQAESPGSLSCNQVMGPLDADNKAKRKRTGKAAGNRKKDGEKCEADGVVVD